MRGLSFLSGDPRNRHISVRVAIGEALGLSEAKEASTYYVLAERAEASFREGPRKCHWSGCIYCGPRCQRKDWEESNHRDECYITRQIQDESDVQDVL
ncbi:hypothetical protein K474DRAFT_1663750 [Panus rudis PR-1116 ss-1]|nr:hypothetical protein K474DRAFT_1663750 [Panus rudis PR-1116 ss-1]